MEDLAWADFLINPRRLRGSDFLMRWSQGEWSEARIIQAINSTNQYHALPYGPSGTAPSGSITEFETYFERLEAAGLGNVKRPDLLVFSSADMKEIDEVVSNLGGPLELPFTQESKAGMRTLLQKAVLAIECENSLWRVEQMPNYGKELKPQRRLGGKLGLAKSAVVPTVIIKEEDRKPLRSWERQSRVPIHIWHVFYDRAYGIALGAVEKLIRRRLILATDQVFQAPGGATTTKRIYKVYYHYAYPLAVSREEPQLLAESIVDKNGHILPFVRFSGGRLEITPEAVKVLQDAKNHKSY